MKFDSKTKLQTMDKNVAVALCGMNIMHLKQSSTFLIRAMLQL